MCPYLAYALINMKALVLLEALSLPEGEPRIHFIGTDHLSYLASVDVKSRTKDNVEYGLLEESWRARTGVPPSSRQEFAGHMCGHDNSVPPTCGNENNREISAADFMRSLFNEIKESRQQIFQDFQIKIVESDRKIFSEFERKFSQQFTVSPKARPVEENVMPPASPAPAKAGQCTTSNVPEEQEMMDNSHISSSEYALRTTESLEDKHTSTPPTLPDSDDVVGHQTIPPASMVQNANLKPTPESSEPDTMDSVQIDLISTTFQPQKMDGHLQNVPPSMDKQISLDESMSSLNLDGSKIISAGCSDEFADVVSIGAAAAHEASCNQQSDGEPSYHGFPNLAVPAKYDHSPALPSKIVSATIPSIISDSSNLHPSPSPLFNSAGPSPAAPSLEPTIKGPALFDTSPATPSILAAMSELFAKHISRNVCTSSEVKTSAHISNLADTMLHVADGKVSCTAKKSGELDASLHKKTTTEAAVSVSPVLPDSVQSISGLLTQCSHSSGVIASDCDDETDSDDVSRDGSASEEDMHCFSIPDCTPTPPSYTYDTQEFIDIPDDPVTPAPNDIIHIPPLQIELQDGYRFKFGGSITLGTCKMFDKLKQLEKNNPLVVAISDAKFVLSKDAKNTYQQHVLDSKARVSSRHRNIDDRNRRRTKIQIKRFHITKGEFVDALKPNGEVCQVLMGLCSVAIMCDWESRTKIILDQQMISQLMKSGPECDQKAIAAKLKKLPLDEIEEIYLPLLNNSHWFLAVVNFVTEIVEFYDSLLVVKEGEHPHKDFWNNLCGNLQEAYSIAKKRSVFIEYFGCTYPRKRIQSTNHDCGYHVIQHNSEDLVGYSKKSMTAFRKYLCHILVYHRFNDLNPLRPHLREEEP